MTRRKTDAEFRKEVKALVGDEYEVLDHYIGSRIPILFEHCECKKAFLMRPFAFLRGNRCPFCAIKIRSAKEQKKAEAFKKEFYSVAPSSYYLVCKYRGTNHKITVLHQKCGYLYQVRAADFIRGNRCPHCSNRLKRDDTSFQYRVKTLGNNKYRPLQEYKGNHNKILMLHKVCGKKYYVTPHDFYAGNRCPHCRYKRTASKLIMPFKQCQDQINRIACGQYYLLPDGYCGTNHKALFYHKTCKHEFEMRPANFFHGNRCPFCQTSKGEKTVIKYLKSKGLNYKSQFRLNDCKDKRPLPFDFAVFNKDRSLNCLIEYQGEQHFYNPFFFHGQWFDKKSILNTQKHDAMKLQYCKDHGIKLIRINHPQTDSKSNSIEFIERLVKRTLDKELKVS